MLLSFDQFDCLIELLCGNKYMNDDDCIMFYGVAGSNSRKKLNRLKAQFIYEDNCLKSLPNHLIILPSGYHVNVLYQRYFHNGIGIVPLTKSWDDFSTFFETKKSKCGLLRKDFDTLYYEISVSQ